MELKYKINSFSKVGKKVRNIAAHSIVSVTTEWVEQRVGQTPAEIMESIKYICEKAGINAKKADWDSYDRMNRCIIREVDKN